MDTLYRTVGSFSWTIPKVGRKRCLRTHSSRINNPFDPLTINRLATDKSRCVVGVPPDDGPTVLTFDGERFSYVGLARFDFADLHYPKDIKNIQENSDIGRVIDLACLNAVAELFVEGEWKFIGAPDFIRMSAGVIKTSGYKDLNDLLCCDRPAVVEVVRSYVCTSESAVTYDNILRITRGIAISDEIGNVPFSLERWKQLLASTQLKATER